MMEIFIFWIGISLLVGVVGKDRNIGFGFAFLWAILLSPIIGLVIALLSDKKKQEDEYISTHSRYENKGAEYEQRLNTNHNREKMAYPNKETTDIQEWRQQNPHKSINDYYREKRK